MISLLLFISYLFGNIAKLGNPNIYIYGGFVFVFVYAMTELMDGNTYAVVWELIKAALVSVLSIGWGIGLAPAHFSHG